MTGPRGPVGDGFPGAKVTDLELKVLLIQDLVN